ncbi:MAG: group I intron-associated PD-(D/E)XK endonuclease [Pseudomonadota bacterium]
MQTGDKGKIAESLVLSELVKRGFKVSIPFGDYRYDLIIEKNGEFRRVQIKYVGNATKYSTIPIVLHSITRKGRVQYAPGELDFIIAYYEPKQSFYVIPWKDVEGKTAINLRLKKAGNNQQAGIIPAIKYENKWDLLL